MTDCLARIAWILLTAAALGDDADLAVARVHSPAVLGRSGTFPDGINGLSASVTLCNDGPGVAAWQAAMAEDHPGVTLNLYRVALADDGVERIEQVGTSWVFHGFAALAQSFCASCSGSLGLSALGPGCSTSDAAAVVGDRFWLGPRGEWDPFAGSWSCLGSWFDGTPVDCLRDETGAGLDPVAHRLQVHDADLLVAGASFLLEAAVLSTDDQDPGDDVAHVGVVPLWTGANWVFSLAAPGQTVAGPAVQSWGDVVTSASLAPDDGELLLAVSVTDLGAGAWRYEYALANLSVGRALDALEVVAGGAASSPFFGDVDEDTGNDWSLETTGDVWSWSLPEGLPTGEPGGGALTWGVAYGFGFTSDRAPVSGTLALSLSDAGPGPDDVLVDTLVPGGFSTWVDLGQAKPGTAGEPRLAGTGPLTTGSPLVLTLADAAPHADVTLVAGAAILAAPFKGGVLVPRPDLLVAGLVTDGAGALSLPFVWPPGIAADTRFVLQAWVQDLGATFGLAASNGLLAIAGG